MLIHIENYRNIDRLDYELEDGKINYLFGVCGSGKSSIIGAISNEPSPADVTVGKTADEIVIRVNDQQGLPKSVRVYNSDEQDALFREEETTGSYEVFIGSEKALLDLEEQFDNAVSSLRAFNEAMFAYQGKIKELQSALGKPTKGKFTKAAKVSKASTVAKNTTPFLKGIIEKGGLEYAGWMSQGMSVTGDFNEGRCPFCGKGMNGDETDPFAILSELKVSDLKPVFSSTTLLNEFGISQKSLETEEGESSTKERLLLLYRISEELQKVTRFCNAPKTSLLDSGIPSLEVDECVYTEFPELKEPIEAIQSKSSEIKRLLGSMKNAFNSVIKDNCRKLNLQLNRLSVPYRFKVTSATRGNNTARYSLVHVNATDNTDMRNSLSTGEKNLVALLLFLANPDGQILLIDDPASSFDDYRRTQIFDLIQKVSGKTVLVVSHDQAFVKRAVLVEGKRDNLGKIQALTRKNGSLFLVDIAKEDVVYLPDRIKNRISEVNSYWAKAINLRLLCDLKKATLETAWGYSSMILHRYNKQEILDRLAEEGTDEQCILTLIKTECGLDLPAIPDDYQSQIDSSELTDFERLIDLRENLNPDESEQAGIHVKMLNDLVHMNDAAAYCLDPYKYQLWAPELAMLIP